MLIKNAISGDLLEGFFGIDIINDPDWIEVLGPDIVTEKTIKKKNDLIMLIKSECEHRIVQKYPIWKQINLIMQNNFSICEDFITSLRLKSDVIEGLLDVMSLSKLESFDYKDDLIWL